MPILLPFRGQIWLADLNPHRGHEQAGTRPCLAVSANKFNHSRAELVWVVPITTNDIRLPSRVKISPTEGNGLTEDSFIICEQVRCISRVRLVRSLGHVDEETMTAVAERIRLILDL